MKQAYFYEIYLILQSWSRMVQICLNILIFKINSDEQHREIFEAISKILSNNLSRTLSGRIIY